MSTVAAEVGREVYALRSLPPGSVIVSDAPLVAYAPTPTPAAAADPTPATHCSVCLATASADGVPAVLGLELCSGPCGCVAQCQTCRDADRHSGFECALSVHRLCPGQHSHSQSQLVGALEARVPFSVLDHRHCLSPSPIPPFVHRIAEFRAWLRQRDRPRGIAAAGGQDHNEDDWLVFVCRAVVLASSAPRPGDEAFPLAEFIGHAHCRRAARSAVAAAVLAAWAAVRPGGGVVPVPAPTLRLVLAVLAALEANAHTMVVDPTAEHAGREGEGEGTAATAGDSGGVGDRVVGWGLFRTGCVLNHSCASNCDWFLTPAGRFEVRTVAQVPKGAAAAICFGPFTGKLAARRAAIEQAHGFRCVCPRCMAEERAEERATAAKDQSGDRARAQDVGQGMAGGCSSSNWADIFSGWVAAGLARLARLEPPAAAAAAAAAAVESQVLPYCRQVERDMRAQLAHVADFSYDIAFYLVRVERNLAGLFNNPFARAGADAGPGGPGPAVGDSPAMALYVTLAESLLRAAVSVVFTCRGSRHHPLFVGCLEQLAALEAWEAQASPDAPN